MQLGCYSNAVCNADNRTKEHESNDSRMPMSGETDYGVSMEQEFAGMKNEEYLSIAVMQTSILFIIKLCVDVIPVAHLVNPRRQKTSEK